MAFVIQMKILLLAFLIFSVTANAQENDPFEIKISSQTAMTDILPPPRVHTFSVATLVEKGSSKRLFTLQGIENTKEHFFCRFIDCISDSLDESSISLISQTLAREVAQKLPEIESFGLLIDRKLVEMTEGFRRGGYEIFDGIVQKHKSSDDTTEWLLIWKYLKPTQPGSETVSLDRIRDALLMEGFMLNRPLDLCFRVFDFKK